MRTWPHAPSRAVVEPGMYIVTAATYQKQHLFHDKARLDLLHDTILRTAEEQRWQLQAWAVFSNHYHFVGISPNRSNSVNELTRKVHGLTAIELNKLDGTPGRRIWYRSWDTRITYQKSYLARLAYVHRNPVKHGLVSKPEDYPWCSARWFLSLADRPLVETVIGMKIDQVAVIDDF